ncbi:MAG: hypothetical protein ACRCUJ_04940 [Phocaeicola sp.]
MRFTKRMTRSYLYVAVSLLVLLFTGCRAELAQELMSDQLYFRLNVANSTLSRSRALPSLEVRYQIADEKGTILQEIQSDYHANQTTIVIEPLPLGSYTLYVLAYDRALQSEGLRINESIATISDTWFEFEGREVPILLQDQLYYTATPFTVTNELEMHQTVHLGYVLAGVDVNRQSSSLYLQNSIQKIELEIDQEAHFYSGMSVAGQYEGSATVAATAHSFLSNHGYYLMPQQGNEAVTTTFLVATENHWGEKYQLRVAAQIPYQGGVKEQVSLDLSAHPDAQSGMLYITESYYNQADRGLIFQDDEHHSIYANANERSFRINKLLQVTGNTDLSLHTRFYSVRPTAGVSIWSSKKKYGERVLLAYYDTIPAWCDARFEIPTIDGKQQFVMESKERVELTTSEIAELLTSELEIECEDEYWNMLQQIRATWNIYFHLYGADPTQSNGGPAGNWRGIRPVHVREGVALMTNIAYMLSVPGYPELLDTYQGQIWGNGGVDDILDVSTIIPRLLSHENFRMGLCGGVYGLGGGATLGLHQGSYFNHYRAPSSSANTIFHEMGHCMGYGHGSGMTYGPWAAMSSTYYVENIQLLPVYSSTLLDSNSNPNRY